MNETLKIFCRNLKTYVEIHGGETLLEISERLRDRLPFNPICARVNNKTESLAYPVYAPKMVEFLSSSTPSGSRTYVRSLCMMLYCALQRCYPGAKMKIEHSISRGWYVRLSSDVEVSQLTANRLKDELSRLHELDLPFSRRQKLTSDVIPIFEKQGLDDKVLLLQTAGELYTTYYRLDDLADSFYGCLAPSTGRIGIFDLIPYKQGFILLAEDPSNPGHTPTIPEQEKMYAAFTEYMAFNRIVGVSNVGEMNRTVERSEQALLINVAEAMHNNKIARIANDITARYEQGGARIVLVSGPSSSGKTTTTKRLAIQLMTNLLEPQMISLDDYFVDREKTPLDENGDYDFESLYALDLELFNKDLNALLRGETVELPYYNFEIGKREYRGNRISLRGRSVLLIEGIHGLNPELTAAIEERMKYKVYVSALTTLSIDDHNWVPTTDNRLLRRIIRDNAYRGVNAAETIRRWPSVRRGEEKWIFPFQENADAMFNSSLLFELGVLKERGEEILKQVRNDQPEYAEAYRLRKFLSYFNPIDEKYIPSTSLIREFIGGSSFRY
ncbi:MAG: nucleoside kinase [Muribaculaceae bacterium]|nr:nucleoside kinase [Muribaculaceae bacterium]MDE6461684.1 nucleoside kinase [Muribaculaceae bacterium]MDE6510345.1 nucleoside kinase [Muribaculaceae bacterium]